MGIVIPFQITPTAIVGTKRLGIGIVIYARSGDMLACKAFHCRNYPNNSESRPWSEFLLKQTTIQVSANDAHLYPPETARGPRSCDCYKLPNALIHVCRTCKPSSIDVPTDLLQTASSAFLDGRTARELDDLT